MIWVEILFCVLVSFMFSGIEAGILSINRIRLKHHVRLRDAGALKLEELLKDPERLLVTVLIVTNLMNIFALTLLTQALTESLGRLGYLVALVVALPVHLILLEMLSKSLFRRFPYRALAALAEPLRVADGLLSPVHFAGRGLVGIIFKRRPARQRKLFVAREEFKYLTIEGERTGTLSKDERQMIHNVVDFRGLRTREVMVAMEAVATVGTDCTLGELLERGRSTGVDRWPVVSKEGFIVGQISVFDVALDGWKRGRVENHQRRIVYVEAEEPAYSVLRKLRAARGTLAAVVDGAKKPLGIVTWEALIERLVSTAAEHKGASLNGPQ